MLTVPLEWLDQIPDAVTGLGSCRLETYSGSTLMGSQTAYFNVSVPASVIPTIDRLTATRADNSVPEEWGLYVQGQSGVTIEATGSGAHGSTITSWRIAGDGMSAGSATLRVDRLSGSGQVPFTATITVSRGRTATKSIVIDVTPYAGPTARTFAAVRAAIDGTPAPTGASLYIQLDASIADCGGHNQGTVTLKYRERGTVDWIEAVIDGDIALGVWIIGGDAIDITKYWDVEAVISDTFQSVTASDVVTTAECYIDRMPGRRRLGIGGYCPTDDTLYIDPGLQMLYGEENIRELIRAAQSRAEEAIANGSKPLDAYPVGEKRTWRR